MEQLLLKMARQIDGLDEASLLSLWEKYATLVARFEPTKRWEEAALVLSIIQAKHWKNQLFNHNWALQAKPATPPENLDLLLEAPRSLRFAGTASGENTETPKKATVLAFRPSSRPAASDAASKAVPDPAPQDKPATGKESGNTPDPTGG